MRLLCPHSEEVVLPYSGVEAQDYTRLCAKRGLQLRVSYNIDPVFFKFNNDVILRHITHWTYGQRPNTSWFV